MPMNITFAENSNVNGSVYGECQAPIRMFVEQRGEEFEKTTILPELFLMGESENFGDMLSSMDGLLVCLVVFAITLFLGIVCLKSIKRLASSKS